MNIAASTIAPAMPKAPAASSVAGESKLASAAGAAAFAALLSIAQGGEKTPQIGAKLASQEKKAPQEKKKEDPQQAAILPVFEAFREILAFGAPTGDSQPEAGSLPELPEAAPMPAEPKLVSLLGAALLPRGIEKSAAQLQIPQPRVEEDSQARVQQPVFDLKLAIEKPEASTPVLATDPPAALQQQPQAAAILAPVMLAAKPVAEELPAPQKAEPIFSTPVADTTTTQSKPQADGHSAPPARVDRPSEILPAEPRATPQSSPREITLRLSDLQQRPTDVRLVERAGQVHVSVRTSDAEFGRTLRSGLNDLMTRLDHAGIKAELSRGSDGASLKNNTRSPNDEQNGSGPRRDQRERRQTSGDAQTWMEEFQQQSDSDGETSL